MINPPARILLPLDGSPESEAAVEVSGRFARALSAEIALFTVVEHAAALHPASQYLERVAGALQRDGLPVSYGVHVGAAAEEILAEARREAVDWISMSTHGRTGLSRLLTGSVTEEVLRKSPVPVLALRPHAVPREWRRVVVPLDGSKRAEQVLPEAVCFSKALGLPLDLVLATLRVAGMSGAGESGIPMAAADATAYLEGVCRRLEATGVKVRPVVMDGRAPTTIVAHAEETDACLICMSSHGRTGLRRLVMGSIAEAVLRQAPCPVLIRRSVVATRAPAAPVRG